MMKLSAQDITSAVVSMKNGGIVVYPTETVYGIGCDPFDAEACIRVRRLKQREDNKPFLLLASDRAQVEEIAGKLSPFARGIADAFWPGPLTMIVTPETKMPDHLYGPTGGIAFRVTTHPVASAMALELGRPIISTSANISGSEPVASYEEAVDVFASSYVTILKNVTKPSGIPSTLIDVTSGKVMVVRKGSISLSDIEKALYDSGIDMKQD